MALSVVPVNKPKISGVIRATPGSNGFATLSNATTAVKKSGAAVDAATAQNNSLLSQTNAILAEIERLQNSQPRQVYAPALDFASINAQARKAAKAAVNPYYTKQLNDFLAKQAVAKKQAQTQATTDISGAEQALADTFQANTITGERTAQDTATNIADINQQQDQNQVDTGTQFAGDRLQQGRDLAAAGLTGGLSAQQVEAAQTARNTTEERQTAAAQEQKTQQELLKSRTFEDLSRSGTLAKQAKEKGVKQINVDLNNFIQNQGLDLKSEKSDLEAKRLGAIAQEEGNQGKLLVQRFIAGIADPAQRNAAINAYGGLF